MSSTKLYKLESNGIKGGNNAKGSTTPETSCQETHDSRRNVDEGEAKKKIKGVDFAKEMGEPPKRKREVDDW